MPPTWLHQGCSEGLPMAIRDCILENFGHDPALRVFFKTRREVVVKLGSEIA